MKRVIVLVLLCILLTSCGETVMVTQTIGVWTPTPGATEVPTITPAPTRTKEPTATYTPQPSNTPKPTLTTRPTVATATPQPTAQPTSPPTALPTNPPTAPPTNPPAPTEVSPTAVPVVPTEVPPTAVPVVPTEVPTAEPPPPPPPTAEPTQPPPPAPAQVIIAGVYNSGKVENVTIQNIGGGDANLSSWAVSGSRGDDRYVFPDGYVLPSGQAMRLHSGEGGVNNPPWDIYWTTKNVWANDGETVFLWDAAGNLIHQLAY